MLLRVPPYLMGAAGVARTTSNEGRVHGIISRVLYSCATEVSTVVQIPGKNYVRPHAAFRTEKADICPATEERGHFSPLETDTVSTTYFI